MPKNTDGLDSLRESTPTKPTAPAVTTDENARVKERPPEPEEPAFVVYDGKCGAEHQFDHKGPRVMLLGGDAFMLYPGLNIIDVWARAKGHETVKRLLADRMVVETDENLRGFDGPADLRKLAATTEQPEALEFLLARERDKKVTAGAGKRRDQKVLETLERRLAQQSKVHRPDLSKLVEAASAKAAVTQRKAAAAS